MEEKLSIKKSATKFEEEVKQFLSDLKFDDIDGARDNFLINGIQVDVCGGWENTLLVIECKSKQKLGKKSLRVFINELRGKIYQLEKGFKEDPKYKKYSSLKYIIVTKNIKVIERDINYANKDQRIYIWDDKFLKYYHDLYSKIKQYAKYDLLGEIRIKPVNLDPIRVPAFQIKFGNVNMYNFVMNPKDLLKFAYVARREIAKERYYQRIINKKSLENITKYINDGGTFPNNIIISFREESGVKFNCLKGPEYNKKWPYNSGISFGDLEFPNDYRSCWIIDGQHRLYSFVNVSKGFNMPITAFENLDIKEQCKFFLDINKNQKPVDPNLIWDLNGEMIPTETDGMISNVAKYLNNEKSSSLYNEIYYPSRGIIDKKGMLKISAICIAIQNKKIVNERTLQDEKNPLYTKDSESCVKKVEQNLLKYFKVLETNFPNNWNLKSKGFILTNGGISVMIGLFEKILSHTSSKYNKKPDEKEFKFYTNAIKEKLESSDAFGLKTLRSKTSGEVNRSLLLNDFIRLIRSKTNENEFGGNNIPLPPPSDYQKEFKKLEKKLKQLIKEKFYDSKNEQWFKDAINDNGMYGKASKKMKKENKIEDMQIVYCYIGLGECFSIIEKKFERFDSVFIKEEKDYSFNNKQDLLASISNISTMRNLLSHDSKTEPKYGDEDKLKINLKKMNECLDEELKH